MKLEKDVSPGHQRNAEDGKRMQGSLAYSVAREHAGISVVDAWPCGNPDSLPPGAKGSQLSSVRQQPLGLGVQEARENHKHLQCGSFFPLLGAGTGDGAYKPISTPFCLILLEARSHNHLLCG